jgi:hypothetical protein
MVGEVGELSGSRARSEDGARNVWPGRLTFLSFMGPLTVDSSENRFGFVKPSDHTKVLVLERKKSGKIRCDDG